MKTLKMCPRFEFEGPRFRNMGPNSGQEFQEEVLFPFLDSLDSSEEASIDFKGTKAFSASFLDEAFSGKRISLPLYEKIRKLSFKNLPYEWRSFLQKLLDCQEDALEGKKGSADLLENHLLERKMLNFQRFAGTKKIRPYNLAEHSYFVGLLFQEFADLFKIPYEKQELSMIFRHDYMEVFTTDLPYQVKNLNGSTRKAWDQIEVEAYEHSPYKKYLYTDEMLKNSLTDEQYLLFRWCDMLELAFFCKEEREMGNSGRDIMEAVERIRSVTENPDWKRFHWTAQLVEICTILVV